VAKHRALPIIAATVVIAVLATASGSSSASIRPPRTAIFTAADHGASPIHVTSSASPHLDVTISPVTEVETGDTVASGDSAIQAIVQVTSPANSGQMVTVESTQLQSSCLRGFEFETLEGGSTSAPVTGSTLSVALDSYGNATLAVSGSACSSGKNSVEAYLNSNHSINGTAAIRILPPQSISSGLALTATPNPLIATNQGDIYAVLRASAAEAADSSVAFASSPLVANCASTFWLSSSGSMSNSSGTTGVLDNDGNVSVLVEGSSCEAGSITVQASLTSPPSSVATVALAIKAEVPPPLVSNVSPPRGLTTGGTVVTISGSGFTGATAVDFGNTPATGASVSGDNTITATAPAVGQAGAVDVTVTADGVTSSKTAADDFTYTVDAMETVVPCDPSCTDSVSTPLNQTAVTANASSGSTSSASLSLVVNTDTLPCPTPYDYGTAVSTLSTSGFAASSTVTVTETVGDEVSTSGVKVCFAKTGATSGVFLKKCRAISAKSAPCLESLVEESGESGVEATFLLPANDPRFWTGGAPLKFKSFSPTKGSPGAPVTIKGKNLTGVVAVVMGGATAAVLSQNNSKVVVTVPTAANSGTITLTAASGSVVSTKPFSVT
jgi:hypothetical protein